ncbi:MAG: hypothetical protein WBF04_07110, partial [Candidatus Sulfotelmatobacter sp.]
TMRAQIGTPRKTLLKEAEEAADLVLLPQRSPLDVKGVKVKVSAEDLVAIVRKGRERKRYE